MFNKRKRKKVLIVGYFNINIGDDLFFKTIIERYPNVDFWICTRHPYKQILSFPNLHIIKFNILNGLFVKLMGKLCKIFFQFNAIVCIGGSIFMEKSNSGVCETMENLAMCRKLFPLTPLVIIGSNYGPEHTLKFRENIRRLIENTSYTCFRDLYSYEIFKDCPKVSYATDIVFSSSRKACNRLKTNTVGISIINIDKRKELVDNKVYYNDFIKYIICKNIKQNKRVSLFSFCVREGDLEMCNNVYNTLSDSEKEKVEIISYDGDIDYFLSKLCKTELLYATRYHAMILGLLYQIPTLPIIYSDKMLNVIRDIGVSNKVIDIRNLCNKMEVNEDAIILDDNKLKQIIKSSEHQFSFTDKVLE